MASVLAESVVKKVGDFAIQQVLNEVSIVSNFTEEFQLLKERIEEINCVLNEADEESSRQQESAKKWLHRVRDIAWEAEDILEECAVDSMYANNFHSCSLGWSELVLRHKMGRRIRKVKDKLISVVADGNNLNIVRDAVPHREEAAESSSRSQFRRSSVLPGDSKPVGIQYKIHSIVSLLENPQIPIIAVVGMGGVGKTYLLQHVYNGRKDRYEKSVWLSISQFYSISKLLNDLAFQLDKDLSEEIKSGISEVLAAERIYRFMLEKRCLVVLDDVWRASREGNLITKLGIPIGGDSQCKILVSTRIREVAVNLNAEIYNMECLTDEESWRLFCAHAFPKSEGNRAPEKLEKVARNMVEECGNLPLAIKTTAASLAGTTELNEWQSKLSKLKKVSTSSDHVMDVLKLSYDSLPAHLKACFAYFGFFPEDEKIECEYLMYLWIGEGFIPTGEDPWDCLDQLASLCMVEVWEDVRGREGGLWETEDLHKYCKIHDLLLDLAIFISIENKGAFSLADAFPRRHSLNTGGVRCCRLFLAKKDIDDHAISESRPAFPRFIRTLTLSRNSNLFNIPATLFNGMRVLRVLDLSYTHISTLPASVGGMKLLKVLNLTETGIAKVPKCVRSLKSLCYLNISVSQVPKWIGELRCLEHLQGDFERLPSGISKLESLRTLRTPMYMSLSKGTCMQCGELRLEDIGQMSELQEIGFGVDDESQLRRMEEGILAPLNNKMRRLRVWNLIHGSVQFPESMSAMRDLEHLSLSDFAVPSWICCLTNLRYLYLNECHCSEYPELQEMPSLMDLHLEFNERCRELPKAFGKSGGFPHLRFLLISSFSELEEFPEMEDGAMACLEKLEISYCDKLSRVGEGLERLKRLKEIKFEGSGTNEVTETLKEGGLYWQKIKKNNPQTTIIMLGRLLFDSEEYLLLKRAFVEERRVVLAKNQRKQSPNHANLP